MRFFVIVIVFIRHLKFRHFSFGQLLRVRHKIQIYRIAHKPILTSIFTHNYNNSKKHKKKLSLFKRKTHIKMPILSDVIISISFEWIFWIDGIAEFLTQFRKSNKHFSFPDCFFSFRHTLSTLLFLFIFLITVWNVTWKVYFFGQIIQTSNMHVSFYELAFFLFRFQ